MVIWHLTWLRRDTIPIYTRLRRLQGAGVNMTQELSPAPHRVGFNYITNDERTICRYMVLYILFILYAY